MTVLRNLRKVGSLEYFKLDNIIDMHTAQTLLLRKSRPWTFDRT